MKELGIIGSMKIIPKKSRFLIIGVIMNRVIDARSKLGCVSWIKKTVFPLIFGIDKENLEVNQIYKAMDTFYNRMNEVMEEFFKKNKENTLLLLYDITSVFFEGAGPEELARYGYSRDKRGDRPHILLCLCLNEKKLPIYFDILEGNIQDKKTVIPMIKELQKKFSLSNSIFVGDRGMISVENIDFLEQEGIDYIVALTHRQARQLLFKENIQPELFDKEIPITIYTEGKKKYILCGSKYRKDYDKIVLGEILERGKKALESVSKMVVSSRLKEKDKVIRRAQKKLTESGCENFYDFRYEGGEFHIIEKTSFIEKSKALCGYYILETTKTEMEDKKVENCYKQLKQVEESFRQLKKLVQIKPVFHWKERMVKTHAFLCILAQTVVNKIKGRLKESGWLDEKKENSFTSFLDILESVELGIFEIEKAKKEILNVLTDETKRMLGIFEIDEEYFTDIEKIKREITILQ